MAREINTTGELKLKVWSDCENITSKEFAKKSLVGLASSLHVE